MSGDLLPLSRLIRALNENAHPGLQRLSDLLSETSPDRGELRRLCQLLISIPAEDAVRPGEAFRCRLGAQMVQMALDREEPWFSPRAAQRQLSAYCRALRLHGLALPEALTALLGARWLRPHDPAWALEMARRAEGILEDLSRAATLQGRPHAELHDAIRQARQLIQEILEDSPRVPPEETAGAPGMRWSASELPPSISPEERIPALAGPLRPAKLFLASFTLLPDTHPRAGDLQFLDSQTTARQSDEADVLIETLEVDGRIHQLYVEKDMEPIVRARPDQILVLRVEGDSMREAGIESGDLIMARRVSGMEARDPSFWVSLVGRLVLAVLVERYQSETHQAFLIKRLTRRNDQWLLCPENPAFEEIPLEPGLHELHPVLAILKPVTS
ncbi:S24 family peptidase [Thermoflexus sp.]|uniref:LexA family protein n=1 Tax=Thermoflexus sp. TaxID=1969742 RepID=UPI001761BD5F|nr:S24 family peptidase [Thermoflexus sp.]